MPVSRKSKKNISKKRKNVKRNKKTRKYIRKIMKGGSVIDPYVIDSGVIVPDDIMFQDVNVTILKPNVKKGVLIFIEYIKSEGKDLCNEELKIDDQIKKGKSIDYKKLIFVAPYFAPDKIDYTTLFTEIKSLYGDQMTGENLNSKVFIRVDPKKTNVFSSQLHYRISEYKGNMMDNSKKTMTKYLEIIKKNIYIEEQKIKTDEIIMYNLFSSEAFIHKSVQYDKYEKDPVFDKYEINRNSEIHVSKSPLTKDYFVLCNGEEISEVKS